MKDEIDYIYKSLQGQSESPHDIIVSTDKPEPQMYWMVIGVSSQLLMIQQSIHQSASLHHLCFAKATQSSQAHLPERLLQVDVYAMAMKNVIQLLDWSPNQSGRYQFIATRKKSNRVEKWLQFRFITNRLKGINEPDPEMS